MRRACFSRGELLKANEVFGRLQPGTLAGMAGWDGWLEVCNRCSRGIRDGLACPTSWRGTCGVEGRGIMDGKRTTCT